MIWLDYERMNTFYMSAARINAKTFVWGLYIIITYELKSAECILIIESIAVAFALNNLP